MMLSKWNVFPLAHEGVSRIHQDSGLTDPMAFSSHTNISQRCPRGHRGESLNFNQHLLLTGDDGAGSDPGTMVCLSVSEVAACPGHFNLVNGLSSSSLLDKTTDIHQNHGYEEKL